MVPDVDERPNSEQFSLQGYGGMPEQTQGFTVQEHEVTNQPDNGGSWNENMGNPVAAK